MSVCDVGVLWLNIETDWADFWFTTEDNYFVLHESLDPPTERETSPVVKAYVHRIGKSLRPSSQQLKAYVLRKFLGSRDTTVGYLSRCWAVVVSISCCERISNSINTLVLVVYFVVVNDLASATLRWTPMMFVVCRKDMVCMNEEDRKLQIAMGAHMKQLIGQSFASFLWSPYGIGQTIIFLPCCFFLLLSSSFFPRLISSRRRLDVCRTSTHGVALVRILNAGLKCTARGSLEMQDAKKSQKNLRLGTIAQLCRAVSSQLRHISAIGKKWLSSNISSRCATIWWTSTY